MIKNPFNYVGGKDKLLTQIHINMYLDNAGNSTLVDLFSGSGIVGVNMSEYFQYTHLNDACWQVIRTIEFFRDNSTAKVFEEIGYWISLFDLSKTNKQGYLDARACYNLDYKDEDTFNPALFYALVTHSFSYNITFNAKREFNVPAGTTRSHFNSSIKEKLVKYQDKLSKNNLTTTALTFSDIIRTLIVSENNDLSNYVFYVDPPYNISDSTYSRIYGLKWGDSLEYSLYRLLDLIDKYNGKFLLSNVVENNSKTNDILKQWMRKYNVVEVDMSYKGCNYQRKNDGITREVLVRNY